MTNINEMDRLVSYTILRRRNIVYVLYIQCDKFE